MLPVSVIMATHNSGATIRSAVTSILEQDHPEFELIVVNDGSTDETANILADDPSLAAVRVITFENNVGRSAARNAAIAAARHSLIAIMDADDFALPHRLKSAATFLESHPELAGVGGQAVGMDGATLWEFGRALTEPDAIRRALAANNMPLVHPSVVVRRDALSAVGGYREDYVFCEDLDLFVRMSDRFEFGGVDEVWLLYRKPALYTWRDMWHTEDSRSRLAGDRSGHAVRSPVGHARRVARTTAICGRRWVSQRRNPSPEVMPADQPDVQRALQRCLELDARTVSLSGRATDQAEHRDA